MGFIRISSVEYLVMSFKKIASSDPRYLAATDILIGDMSDINYEFLLFDRPVILLANQWLRDNFPDIGIKTDLNSLDASIRRSIDNPCEFAAQRRLWLDKTIYNPDGNSTRRVIDEILRRTNIKNPHFYLVHGKSDVLRTHLEPFLKCFEQLSIKGEYWDGTSAKSFLDKDNTIWISANNSFLKALPNGFKVHIDHGVKGIGVTDFERQIEQYKEKEHFPFVNLHITEGQVSFEKTKMLLGPYSDRVVMVGYPKSDTLLRLNNKETKKVVFKELSLNPRKILVTYAPAGKHSFPFKQGASLCLKAIRKLKMLAKNQDYNILVKIKEMQKPLSVRIIRKSRTFLEYRF